MRPFHHAELDLPAGAGDHGHLGFKRTRRETPRAFHRLAPGWLATAGLPWDAIHDASSTLKGLNLVWHNGGVGVIDSTRLGLMALVGTRPKVGAPASRQPWAERWNAVGVLPNP